MSQDTATSVSKGCFAYKGKVKRANAEDYMHTAGETSLKNRFRLYTRLRDDLQVEIDILRSDLNSKIFDDLISFSAACHSSRDEVDQMPIGEIPTAVLITGVNTPDHDVMFSNLNSMLKEKVTPLVARVRSKDCSRLAALIGNIVQQFTNMSFLLDDGDEGPNMEGLAEPNLESSPVKLKVTMRRRRTVTMSSLVKWYQENYGSERADSVSPAKKIRTNRSPRKKSSENVCEEIPMGEAEVKKRPLVVIMLEDAEDMNPIVLQDFISLCSSYLPYLPIILVLGVATAVTAIHQLLPTSVSSLLCIEKFQAPPASRYLTQLMDKIIMTAHFPFKLGPKVFHFLLDTFLYHDFSILNFVMGFQYSMIEHFLSNPLSLLCCPPEECASVAAHLTHAQLEDIRRQPSFMRYVEETSGPEQAQLLTDDAATRKRLAAELQALHSFHSQLFPTLRFLHCLGMNLPRHPLGKQLRELYSVCLTQDLCSSEGYTQAFNLLRVMSGDELCELLASCLETLTESKDKFQDIGKLHDDVSKFVYRLKHIHEEPEEETEGNEEATGRVLPQRAKLHELKEKLQSLSSHRKKSPYERLREEILDTLHNHFKKLLLCPLSHPMHEIFYFNDLAAIREHMKAAPRCSIQRTLMQPSKYLNCVCCQCDTDIILPSMPDMCIVYKLHLECGTLINLYDWLQAFVTVVTSSETSRGKKWERNKKLSTELRARFIRAVSELQFLGFIKATRRKTDHVTRLTW